MEGNIQLVSVNDFHDEDHVEGKLKKYLTDNYRGFNFDKVTNWNKETGRLIIHCYWERDKDDWLNIKVQLIKS